MTGTEAAGGAGRCGTVPVTEPEVRRLSASQAVCCGGRAADSELEGAAVAVDASWKEARDSSSCNSELAAGEDTRPGPVPVRLDSDAGEAQKGAHAAQHSDLSL
eukprot:2150417-Rhodomonas_salina.1